ncbi:flagellar biosynthesis anti-sigma factor FlgM [Porticoccus sp. W117]|uniref:flagellar biosynthesis anti-sigma factor FlgM n=1 Tax=Porticoccus sp. W117 TaxID=3054777 RepID=UPI002591924C|nr:flagellar biosynthesis anti-sigma factor FlgM [Porticoccus sp. W117]MDM3871027.1 flagellar biosynthesis anti-sigma factor FlgM [Porticoccus sp. W117]
MDSDIKQLRPGHLGTPASKVPAHAKGPEKANENSIHGRNQADAPAAGDTVTVTDQAARLQELEQSLANTPVVDSARVAELREAIASGSYQPDPQRIADKLSQLERDLL